MESVFYDPFNSAHHGWNILKLLMTRLTMFMWILLVLVLFCWWKGLPVSVSAASIAMWQEEKATSSCVWKPPSPRVSCYYTWRDRVGYSVKKLRMRRSWTLRMFWNGFDFCVLNFLMWFSKMGYFWSCLGSIFSLISLEYLHSSHIVMDMFLDHLMTNCSHVVVIFELVWCWSF